MRRNRETRWARVALAIAVVLSAVLGVRAATDRTPEAASSLPTTPTTSTAVRPVASVATTAPSTPAEPASTTAATTAPPAATTATGACRAAVLVHGGAYVVGDHRLMAQPFAEPLTAHGWRVWNVDYPLLADHPDIPYDPLDPWYPRLDLRPVPPAMREVHERAVAAVAPMVDEALATGCVVTLVGVSAGGSIVLDLAHRYPDIHEAVVVSSSIVAPERIGGAPLLMFYGGLDKTVYPAATIESCDRWRLMGSPCEAKGVWGGGHGDAAVEATALDHLLAET